MNRRIARTVAVLLALASVAFSMAGCLPPPPPPPTPEVLGQWGAVLNWNFQGKHAAVLGNGKVLLWSTGDQARVWDPATNSFELTPATFGDLHCAGQATLADGRVIVTGGQNGSTHVGIPVTGIFDPATNQWTVGEPMTYSRWYPTTTTLADGRVLVTSGDDEHEDRVGVHEIYDPATDSWTTLTGAPRSQPLYPLMFQLPNGMAYEAGPKTSTALLDTSGLGAWTAGPPAPYSTSGYSESAVMYSPGKILRAGGGDPAIKRAAVIDMTAPTPAWREIGSMTHARRRMNLTILADGTVLAVGGTGKSDDAGKAVLTPEIWNPATERWTPVASMGMPRMYHSTAVLLPDGRILTAGGEGASRLNAQIYSPPYLFKGPRPVVADAPAQAAYGSELRIASPDAASVTSVALIRPSAVTHAYDMNQRYVPLDFTFDGTDLVATAPANGGVAPPGDYMLIVKNGAGVPSVARFVRIG
jgi:hypothetical protein